MPRLSNPLPLPRATAAAASPAPWSTAGVRPTWSGLLRFSLVAIPIRAYTAARSTSASRFHFLHANCGQRIAYHKHCPSHGKVEADAIVRGYAYARGRHVVVEPEELDKLRPARDKALVLEQFVPVGEVDPSFYAGRSLHLLPDGQAAQHPYAVLVAALHEAGKAALGRVVLSTQRQLVLVRAAGCVLALDVLHYPAQVRPAKAWESDVPACAASAAELDLAGKLIAMGSAPLDWPRYRDTSAEELATLIEAKVANQPSVAGMPDEPVAVLPLLDALKQSVAAACNGKTPEPAAKGRKGRARRATG
jgi:DNA end-binding protein Ku